MLISGWSSRVVWASGPVGYRAGVDVFEQCEPREGRCACVTWQPRWPVTGQHGQPVGTGPGFYLPLSLALLGFRCSQLSWISIPQVPLVLVLSQLGPLGL